MRTNALSAAPWALAACIALSACAAPPTGGGPVAAAADDPCGPQVVVFVSAGDLFGTPPRRLGAPTAADMAAELARENAAIERLQIAFDALLYCRWTEVRVIRADTAAGLAPAATQPARLATAQGRLRADLARGEGIRQAMAARSARIEAAVEQAAPGTTRHLAGGQAARLALPQANASAPVPLRVRPEPDAPVVTQLLAGAPVTLRPAAGGFVFADGGAGARGYAPSGAFTLRPPPAAPDATTDPVARLRSLAATNIARRETFAQSLALADQNLARGFEPSS